MKYLKKFENTNDILYHKNDIIISEWSKTNEIYLVLDDYYNTDSTISVVYIGCISKYSVPYYSIVFNYDAVSKENKKLFFSEVRYLNDDDKNMMCDVLYNSEIKIDKYLTIIEEISGVNLKELPELKNHQLSIIANKFNI